MIAGNSQYFTRIDTPEHLRTVKSSGKVGILVGVQNSGHFRTIDDVDLFYGLGQRVSQLTYNSPNRLGAGSTSVDNGLTEFGAAIVAQMNAAGMAVDVSHCGDKTSMDAFRISKQPVLVTHSNCRALVPDAARCKSDAVLRAMAAQGGVMGITAVRAFVSPRSPSLDDLLDHFAHLAQVAGIDHVGLGSDVDVDALDPRTGSERPAYTIRGMTQARRTFALVEGLLRRGWTEPQLELVLGGNFRRALAAIWERPLTAPTAASASVAAPARTA